MRIDHPDGLFDPPGYLRCLRDLVGADADLVIEKILATGEAVDPGLPIQGTTGYDALREIGGVFLDPAGHPRLADLVRTSDGELAPAPAVIGELKADAAVRTLKSELLRVRRDIVAAAGADHPRLTEAIVALLTHIEVYRCDYPGLSATLPTAIAETVAAAPDLAAALVPVASALNHAEPAARMQQLCQAMTTYLAHLIV